ncbi:DUF2778 domain-containing protein [Pararhizobium mangrovi]|uniref:DUF2778 domain-containing protein n=2 Tax=Pararhizobium mangrovi TaxID=2590452 RepID=A0A506TW83_9HYPH|nr:DUF2778 domain-containing protein [Pararhizobium mangrovi]
MKTIALSRSGRPVSAPIASSESAALVEPALSDDAKRTIRSAMAGGSTFPNLARGLQPSHVPVPTPAPELSLPNAGPELAEAAVPAAEPASAAQPVEGSEPVVAEAVGPEVDTVPLPLGRPNEPAAENPAATAIEVAVAEPVTTPVETETVEDVPAPLPDAPLPSSRPQPNLTAQPALTAEPTAPENYELAYAKPETVTPETIRPETVRPKIAAPKIVERKVATPKIAKLETVRPEPAAPEAAAPKRNGNFLSRLFGFSHKSHLANVGTNVAVYSIKDATVYLPGGETLEAHSGMGRMTDDPRYTRAKNHGPTPVNVYNLTMRRHLFHGVQAVRMLPADGQKKYGRDGFLAHTYMLAGRPGESNGCVVFKNYSKFLKAFKNGKINRMVVVADLSDLPTQVASR